jgi:diguanylate cyclase (GGDEF)-like protein
MYKTQMSEVLTEFALTLVSDVPDTGILDHLVQRIVDMLPVTSAGVTLIGPSNDPRYVAASDDAALTYETLQTDLGEGPGLLAYRSGSPVLVPDLDLDEQFLRFAPAAAAAGLRAVFAFPLFHHSGRFGALDLYSSTPGPLSDSAVEAAATLANVAAVYLINAQAREDAAHHAAYVNQMVNHDELTGLPNMRLLNERIEHANQRALRSHASSAMLFIDLDRFKQVNDTYGHEIGDHLLRAIAVRLPRLVRPSDTVARIHGDEFVILCEDLHGRADLDTIVQRIRLSFERPFQLGDLRVSVTASIGIAFVEEGGAVTQALVTLADHDMYAGRRLRPRPRAEPPEDLSR